MMVDMVGDWREELITSLPGELRVYSTTIPAKDRRVSLMQDPLYRNGIVARTMGYTQPPMTSYYLGAPVK
jgi:rhamnogalacturonan endolyase